MNSLYCILFFCFSNSFVTASNENYNLKSISVLFRHGDRTPYGFYPTDPYKNHSFEPMGHAGLTNKGKKRAYELGSSLRSRYNEFLGDTYKSSDISVVSTDYERTKMSLLLVLAGLYPPKDKQIWENNLEWQPIPINSVPDDALTFMYPATCPTFTQELDRVRNSTEYKKDLSRFDALMKNLTILTGRETNKVELINQLYHTLTAESAMDLPLPEWTKPYFPNGLIINATLFQYDTESYTKKLTMLNGGLFLRKILNDWNFGIRSEMKSRLKVNLYSVHENNVGGVLKALNVWKSIIPAYSSAVIFELSEKDSKFFVKIMYYKGIPSEYEERIVPGCSEYCPIEKFVEVLGDVIPDDLLDACFGPINESQLIPKDKNPIVWVYDKIRLWFHL